MSKRKVLIVGNGIAAKLLAFTLYKDKGITATMIANEDFAPMCSTRSTAINCLRGTKKGISKLGDLIVDSYEDFVHFYNTFKPEGVEKSFELQIWDKDYDKWQRRYEDFKLINKISGISSELSSSYEGVRNEAYLFDPINFLNWLDQQYEKEFINDYVTSISKESNWKIETHNGLQILSEYVIICSSYESSLFSSLIRDDVEKRTLLHSKPVSGTYLRFSINDFNESQFNSSQAFSLAYNNLHFIYRPFASDVLIGSTSLNNEKRFLPEKEKVTLIYQKISQLLDNSVSLPPIEKGELVAGIRHKAQKRVPFWGEIHDNCFGIWGLYKNGYSFGFKAALEVARAID